MPTSIITTEDLSEFKIELLKDIKSLLSKNSRLIVNKHYRSNEVKELLSISSSTLQNFRVKGILPYTQIGSILLYDAEEVKKMLDDYRAIDISNKIL